MNQQFENALGLGMQQQSRVFVSGGVIGKPPAVLDRISGAINASQALADRVAALVDLIVGPSAGSLNAFAGQSSEPEKLGELVSNADEARVKIIEANDALDRLARAFGL